MISSFEDLVASDLMMKTDLQSDFYLRDNTFKNRKFKKDFLFFLPIYYNSFIVSVTTILRMRFAGK